METALLYGLTGLLCATVGFCIAAFVCGASRREQAEANLGGELDSARLNYLTETKADLLYNDELKSWGVVSRDRKFVYASPTVRGALDGARHKAVRVQT